MMLRGLILLKSILTALCVSALIASLPAPAAAGNMRQSPILRKNYKRFCPNGTPMRNVRTGRTVIYTCT